MSIPTGRCAVQEECLFWSESGKGPNHLPSGSCSHHLPGRKRRESLAIAPLQTRIKTPLQKGFYGEVAIPTAEG